MAMAESPEVEARRGLALGDKDSGLSTKSFQRCVENFSCENCGHQQRGTGYTNHCSKCLYSKHVDVQPGDRAADCGGLMAPVAVEPVKSSYRIFQRCVACGHERWNKSQEEDDFDTMLAIMAKSREEHEERQHMDWYGRSGKGMGKGRGRAGGKSGAKGRQQKDRRRVRAKGR